MGGASGVPPVASDRRARGPAVHFITAESLARPKPNRLDRSQARHRCDSPSIGARGCPLLPLVRRLPTDCPVSCPPGCPTVACWTGCALRRRGGSSIPLSPTSARVFRKILNRICYPQVRPHIATLVSPGHPQVRPQDLCTTVAPSMLLLCLLRLVTACYAL